MSEAIQPDVSTVHAAAQRITSLMDEAPPEEPTEDGNPSIQEEQAEEPEAIEESTEEEAQEASETEEPESTEEPDSSETDVVTNFSDLAEHLGVERDYLDSLKVPTKINGVEQEATIKELVQSYQKGSAADVKLMELAEERKQFNASMDQTKEALQSEWNRIQTLSGELSSMLSTGDDGELEELRQSDPAEYAARIAERREKAEKASKIQSELQQEQSKKFFDEYQSKLKTERQSLLNAIPEWNDESTAKTENSRLREYLKSQGLQDFEIDGKVENGNIVHPGIIDHRAIVLARKAMMFDEAQKATKPKKAKLKSLPKVGAGKPVSRSDAKMEAMKKERKKLKDSGKVNDAALLIRKQLFGE